MIDNPYDAFDDDDASVVAAPTSMPANIFDRFDGERPAEIDAKGQVKPEKPQASAKPAAHEPSMLPATPGVSFTDDPELSEAVGRLAAATRKEAREAEDKARGESFIGGLTDPQQYAEFGKGIVPGAIQFGATALKGASALPASAQYNAAGFGRTQLDVMDRIDRGETVSEMNDAYGYQHMDAEQRKAFRAEAEKAAAAFNPTPLKERGVFKAGEAVSEFGRNLIPAAPGYEASVGRQLGEGIGSMVAGLPAGFVGRIPATILFGASGSGEAVERAMDFDRAERAAGRPGLSEQDMALAAVYGVAPGATDMLPLEVLMGRLKIPAPWRPAFAKVLAKIGGQALVEGVQEGGQQFLQNEIAKEIYNPDQSLTEDVLPNIGVGAGVGGIAEGAKTLGEFVLKRIAGRRGHLKTPGQQPPAGEQPTEPPSAGEAAAPETVPTPPAAEEAPRPLREDFDAFVRLEEEFAAIPEDSQAPEELRNTLLDAEQTLVEEFRDKGLPGDTEAETRPINSIDDVKRAFDEATSEEIEAYWQRVDVAALEPAEPGLLGLPQDIIDHVGKARPDLVRNNDIAGITNYLRETNPGLAAKYGIKIKPSPTPDSLRQELGVLVTERSPEAEARRAEIASALKEQEAAKPQVVAQTATTEEPATAKPAPSSREAEAERKAEFQDVRRWAKEKYGDGARVSRMGTQFGIGVEQDGVTDYLTPAGGVTLEQLKQMGYEPAAKTTPAESEPTIAAPVAEAPAAEPSAEQPASPAQRTAFRDLLAGTTPRKQWAAELGASPAEMDALIRDAESEGLLRVDRNGVVRRTAKAKGEARGEQQMFALRGFYSPALRAAESLTQEKGTGEQFLAQITKMPGVKKDELDWMGLEEFLRPKKSITKAEVLDFMRANQAALDEKVLGGKPSDKALIGGSVTPEQFRNRTGAGKGDYQDADIQFIEEFSTSGKTFYVVKRNDSAEYSVVSKALEDLGRARNRAEAEHIGQGWAKSKDESPRFATYKVPGGENYRELLIRLPELGDRSTLQDRQRLDEIHAETDALIERAVANGGQLNEVDNARHLDLVAEGKAIQAKQRVKYTSKHFQDQEIAHLRVDDRTGPGGEKVLFINEVQSDLHQEGRRSGYAGDNIHAKAEQARAELRRVRDEADFRISPEREQELNRIIVQADKLNDETFSNTKIPDAPFKGDLWLELALKRALQYATENGYDAISWARSDQIARAVGAEPEKLALQYDSKIGKFYDKYTKKWGGKVDTGLDIDTAQVPARRAHANAMLDALGDIAQTPDRMRAAAEKVGTNPLLRITPEMRASVEAGQPLFAASDREQRSRYVRQLSAGHAVDVEPAVVSQITAILEPASRKLPKGINIGAISRIEPITGRPDEFKATFTRPDGSTFTGTLETGDILAGRAAYDPNTDSIISMHFGGLSGAPAGEEFVRVLRGGIDHELLHALWGRLPAPIRSALASHADTLKILDMPFKQYMSLIGDPSARTTDPRSTVRDLYEELYGDRKELPKLLQEEAVAHMVELYSHGRLSEEEVAPVQGLLDAIISDPAGLVEQAAAEGGGEAMLAQGAAPGQDITETPAFKRWFGDSKVVDENGKPLVVYHGTRRDFSKFSDTAQRDNDGGFYGRGFYFADNASEAEYFATLQSEEGSNIIPAYLNIRKPFEINDGGALTMILPRFFDQVRDMKDIPRFLKSAMDRWDQAVKNVRVERVNLWDEEKWKQTGDGDVIRYKDADSAAARFWETEDEARSSLTYKKLGDFPMGIDALIVKAEPTEFREFLKKNGYDGVHAGSEWVAFEPTQIKSAIGNRGTFDPNDPRITFALRGRAPSLEDSFAAIRAELGLDAGDATATPRQQIDAIAQDGAEAFAERYGDRLAEQFAKNEASPALEDPAQIAETFREFVQSPDVFRARDREGYEAFTDALDAEAPALLEAIDDMHRLAPEEFPKVEQPPMGTRAMQATAGKIPDSKARQAKAGTERPDQSLADLVGAFNKALGMTVRQGRLSPGLKMRAAKAGQDLRGQTSMETGVVRMRVPNEIDTLAHEGGHALENRFKKALEAIKKQFATELEPLASPGPDQLSEGFAEWFRRYVTNPSAATKTAPGFEAAFEEFLKQQDAEMLASLAEIRKGYQAWIAAPSGGAVASAIATTVPQGSTRAAVREFKEEGLKKTFQNWIDRIYTAVFDDLHPMRLAVDGLLDIARQNFPADIRASVDVKTTNNAYKLLRLARDGYAAGHMDLLYGVHDYRSITPNGPSMRDAIASAFGGFDRSQWTDEASREFGAYLVSRRMVQEWDRFKRGEISAPPDKFSLADHTQAIKDFEAKYPGFQKGASELYSYQRNMLRKKRDAGLITPELYDELIQRKDYVPLMRDMSDRGGRVEGRQGARKDKFSVIAKFRGSQRDVINPLESISKDSYETAMIIARNDALKALDALARAAGPDGGRFAERIPAHEMKASQVRIADAIKAASRDAGIDPADMQIMLQAVDDQLGDNAIAQVWKGGEISEKGEPIVYLWEDGKRVPIRLADGQFGHDMLHAVTGLGREVNDWWVNLLSLPSMVLRFGVTASADFIGANFLRDQVSAWVLTKDFVPFWDGAKGIYSDLTLKDVSRIYSRVGGIMGGSNVAAQHESRIRREILQLRRKGIRFTLNPLTRDFWRMTEFSESGTRLAVFQKAFDRAKVDGLNDWESAVDAAFIARDYIDFGRHGSRMLAARRLVPFLNAALQGLDRTVRGARGAIDADRPLRSLISPYIKSRTGQPLTVVEQGNKKQAAQLWGYTVALGMIGLGLALLYKDDEEYEEISDHIKATHWLFRVNGQWVRIPKPFEIAFFSNLLERTFDYVYKDDKTAPERFVSGLYEITVPPHSIPGLTVTTELLTDHDFFSGRPIVGPFLKSLPPELQFNAYASEFGKWLGKQVNISPAYIDHFITGFGASYGREFVNASDRVMPALGRASGGLFGLPTKPVADPALSDYFFLRRFTTDPTRGSTSMRQFWEMMAQENGSYIQAANGYKHLVDKVRDAKGAQEFLDSLPEEERAYALLQAGNSEGRSKYRRLHPLNRAQEIVTVAGAMRREINLNRLYEGGKGDPIELTPQQMRTVSDLLADITMREARNALVALKVRGWENKKPLRTDTVYAELEAASPEVHQEFVHRLKSKKIPDFETVVKAWPVARDRILEEGSAAIISDLYSRDYAPGEGAVAQ